jgi:hypothetical protein
MSFPTAMKLWCRLYVGSESYFCRNFGSQPWGPQLLKYKLLLLRCLERYFDLPVHGSVANVHNVNNERTTVGNMHCAMLHARSFGTFSQLRPTANSWRVTACNQNIEWNTPVILAQWRVQIPMEKKYISLRVSDTDINESFYIHIDLYRVV